MLSQQLKKNNLSHELILQKVTKMMFQRVIYLPSPIRGKEGKKHFVTLPTKSTRYFPINTKKAMLVYTGIKLGSNLSIKGITKKEHNHDLVYSVKCP